MSRLSERERLARSVDPLNEKVAAAFDRIRGSHPNPVPYLVARFSAAYTALGLNPADEIERVTTEALAVA